MNNYVLVLYSISCALEELNTAVVLVGDANFSIFALVGALSCPGPSPRVPNDLRKCPSRVKSEIRWLPHSLT